MTEVPPIERFKGESTHAYAARYTEWAERAQMIRLGMAWPCHDCGGKGHSPRGEQFRCVYCRATGITTERHADWLAKYVSREPTEALQLKFDEAMINMNPVLIVDKKPIIGEGIVT